MKKMQKKDSNFFPFESPAASGRIVLAGLLSKPR